MNEQVQFAHRLFDRLWEIYRDKVPYAKLFQDMVAERGGRFVNDHIALRTLHIPEHGLGPQDAAGIFLALGMKVQEQEPILFSDQHLEAFSYRHPDPSLPKVFISELHVGELDETSQKILRHHTKGHRHGLPEAALEALGRLDSLPEGKREDLLERMVDFFTESPWRSLPYERDVRAVNKVSQYGAWVMLFGNQANHFTASVNAIDARDLDDIEKVATALASRGVPMKEDIEGAPGSKLRQTSTKAAMVHVKVLGDRDEEKEIQWPYAYFEIAQRGIDPQTDQLFHGFLGSQATRLFDMTRIAS